MNSSYILESKINSHDKKLDSLDRKINSLDRKLDSLDRKLDLLIKHIEGVQNDTKRMDSHITFVEGVYDSVKSPFHFIMNKISMVRYTPQITE